MINRHAFLKKVPPSEPVFILRAQDKFMPKLLKQWALMVQDGGEYTPERQRKVEEAWELAKEVKAWQNVHGCKVPD